ncbi:hypothetical protein [Litorilituus sediminis]|uniref:Uncharacterized protein n=1 Tax=Litorilituus sediminis TaxID=718192 RepID=A0A4P6P6G4_9GAMM|nr:hypothetical protein [Litorilituus sediminis]QBG35027.1 hypothetical protein EMK97_04400 [Litorilituus sediminis]
MLLFLVVFFSVICALFFYVQAVVSGLGRKRWALAGMLIGPFAWPMFTMKKRMQMNHFISCNSVLFKA